MVVIWLNHPCRDNPAWLIKPSSQSPETGVSSFASIQQQQQKAKAAPSNAPKKSLREIQEEEQEIAFLQWFEEESAKVQQHAAGGEKEIIGEASSPRGKKPRGNRPRGRGRGAGTLQQTAHV